MWHCSVHVEGKPHPKAETSKKYMLNLIGSDWYSDWQARLDYGLLCHPVGLRLTTKHWSMYMLCQTAVKPELCQRDLQGLQGGSKIFYLQTKSPPLPKARFKNLSCFHSNLHQLHQLQARNFGCWEAKAHCWVNSVSLRFQSMAALSHPQTPPELDMTSQERRNIPPESLMTKLCSRNICRNVKKTTNMM